MLCPLCNTPTHAFTTVERMTYVRCPHCGLTALHADHHLEQSDERAQYDLHDNQVDNAGYRGFLSRLADPLFKRISAQSTVLDYGCGPGPALAAMFRQAGHTTTVYDPFYAPDDDALQGRYDVITCTEVAEHWFRPGDQLDRLDCLLNPGGWLGLMTCFQTDDARFADWHYRRDPTHVCFYSRATLAFIADRYGWTLDIPRKDVAVFHKPQPG